MKSEESVDLAEARLRMFRDEAAAVADGLEAGGTVVIADLLARLHRACASVEDADLGADAALVRAQFDALFERLESLAAERAGRVPADSLGLPADARFLRDMADYIARRYGLEDDPA